MKLVQMLFPEGKSKEDNGQEVDLVDGIANRRLGDAQTRGCIKMEKPRYPMEISRVRILERVRVRVEMMRPIIFMV